MRKRRIIGLLALAGIAAVVLVAPWRSSARGWQPPRPCRYELEGTWIYKAHDYDCVITATFVPESPANNRVAFTLDFVDSDPLFPGVECPQMTVRGEAIRTGPRTFKSYWIFYGRYEDRSIGYIFVAESTVVMTSPNTLEDFAELTLYWPEDDTDGDGLPDKGGIPLPSGYSTAKRYVPVSH